MDIIQVRRLKVLMLVSSIVCLVFLLLAAFEENFSADWREHQSDYAAQLKQIAHRDGQSSVRYPIEVRQIYLGDLSRIDRCVTCHVGVDNPAFQDAPTPLAAHPGDLLKDHPSDKFGCTICHQGQGRATVQADAHGEVPHWPEPLLRGSMVYTSCGRCHYEYDLYGGQADLYGQVQPIEQISRGEITATLPGAETIARGKQLVVASGCLGCHKYRGRGGSLGPDLTHVGEKTRHDFDFQHVAGEHTVENWMYAHFKSPTAVVPNTVMPELGLTDSEAHDLAAYMLSLKRKSAPATYTPLPQTVDPTPARGETLYQMYCSSCHGANGIGAIVRDPGGAAIDRPQELITPSLRNVDTLGVASDGYLRQIIAQGRPGTSMPAWHAEGLTDDEIELLVGYIRRWERPAGDATIVSASRGNAHYGRALFRLNCAACHGADGRGGAIGVSLRSPTFLAVASDAFLVETIVQGRADTAMPSWRDFDHRELSDLLAYIRGNLPLESDRAAVLDIVPVAHSPNANRSIAIGKQLYRSRCAVCHGDEGEGAIGPSLNNQSMLSIASNEFLHDTIVRGRPGTAMPAWRQLSTADVVDLITYLRHWQTEPPKRLPATPIAGGDWQHGQLLFQGICVGCHGPRGEGAIGPQLTNPVFMETVSDEMLKDWISYGRKGTQMRPHLRGQQGAVDLTDTQINDIITYLRYERGQPHRLAGERIGIGFAPRGRVLYEQMCAACHGVQGEGLTGPAIGNRDFLAAATDGYLAATIVLGRDGTAMRAMGRGAAGVVELRADHINDLIAHLRNLAGQPEIAHRFEIGASLSQGKVLYEGFCAGCHGADGKGGFAPELNNDGFLRAATDGYLQATIIRGRRGTAMRSFGFGSQGIADLTQDQINNIVAHIRQWSPDTRPLRRTEPFSLAADPDPTESDRSMIQTNPSAP